MTAVCKILTLFPEFFTGPLQAGLLGKAIESAIIRVDVVNIRDYSDDAFRRCDDYPYGGGSGMVLKAEPLMRALDAVSGDAHVICTSPGGTLLNQDLVKRLAGFSELCIICGHYEGIDERVIEACVDQEVSVGDYVLSGGEYASLIILDSIARYVPGFMSNAHSLTEESFEQGLLEYPQYTRPAEYRGMRVPEVLISGDHRRIHEWRRAQAIEKTKRVRPDLYAAYCKNANTR